MPRSSRSQVQIEAGPVTLEGTLTMPEGTNGLVVFAHGSGSSRHSPRNRFVAEYLNEHDLGTLLFDLLTAEEELVDRQTAALRFDIELLALRLIAAVDWVSQSRRLGGARVGLFGASTGAAAALIAAARRPDQVEAVVSRGGRPDLAGPFLPRVAAPTLLIVGGDDHPVIQMNQGAATRMKGPCELQIVPGATHLFEEPGALAKVAYLATQWFVTHLRKAERPERPRAELR